MKKTKKRRRQRPHRRQEKPRATCTCVQQNKEGHHPQEDRGLLGCNEQNDAVHCGIHAIWKALETADLVDGHWLTQYAVGQSEICSTSPLLRESGSSSPNGFRCWAPTQTSVWCFWPITPHLIEGCSLAPLKNWESQSPRTGSDLEPGCNHNLLQNQWAHGDCIQN